MSIYKASDALINAIMSDSPGVEKLVQEHLSHVPLTTALTHMWVGERDACAYSLVPWRQGIRYWFERGAQEKVW